MGGAVLVVFAALGAAIIGSSCGFAGSGAAASGNYQVEDSSGAFRDDDPLADFYSPPPKPAPKPVVEVKRPPKPVKPTGPYADFRAEKKAEAAIDAERMAPKERGVHPYGKYLKFKKKGTIKNGDSVLIWSYGKPMSGSMILPDDNYTGRCYRIRINTLYAGKDQCEAGEVLDAAERAQNLIYGMGGYRVTFFVKDTYDEEPLCSLRLERVSCWQER